MTIASYAIRLEPYQSSLEDRARVIEADGALILAVADGAGGISHGDRAAEAIVRSLDTFAGRGSDRSDERTWSTFLAEADHTIARAADVGETTAVALAVTPGWIVGASVGDSEAWLITAEGDHRLTHAQRRKPLLGSGLALPV